MQLTRWERRALIALLETAADGSKLALDRPGAVRYFEEVLDFAHAETRWGIRLLLFSVAYLPALWGDWRFWRPLTRRSLEERTAYAEGILSSRFFFRRQLFKGLCVALYFPHYGRTEAQRALGYDAPALNTHYQRSAP